MRFQEICLLAFFLSSNAVSRDLLACFLSFFLSSNMVSRDLLAFFLFSVHYIRFKQNMKLTNLGEYEWSWNASCLVIKVEALWVTLLLHFGWWMLFGETNQVISMCTCYSSNNGTLIIPWSNSRSYGPCWIHWSTRDWPATKKMKRSHSNLWFKVSSNFRLA